jgi:uncharacterized OB-fold protein
VIEGVRVSACARCDWEELPLRYWCPRCGSDDVADTRAPAGRVEETIVLERAAGHGPVDVAIGLVRLPGGGVIVARLEPGAVTGVQLLDDAGAAVARGA